MTNSASHASTYKPPNSNVAMLKIVLALQKAFFRGDTKCNRVKANFRFSRDIASCHGDLVI